MRTNPHLFEANAKIFLRRLSERYGKPLTLAGIPDQEWKRLAAQGFDLVWLMGVWQRSAGARRQALAGPELRREYDAALPGWSERDVAGSPYAIVRYELDSELGGRQDLKILKSKLNGLGLGLILDFVPNHLAVDHRWVEAHPGRFVRGNEPAFAAHPGWFFKKRKHLIAHGRDPYFPPWTDTAQINFFSEDAREALIREMLRIAKTADGIRCDMAMLALNDVFEKNWRFSLPEAPQPAREFWQEAVRAVKEKHPQFLFLAEAYWNLEWRLQELGFDFTYDKTLYDRLRDGNAAGISEHLKPDGIFQKRSAHFIENHDEPRALAAFGREKSLAAAVICATIPGLRLFHDGQMEGRRVKLPVQMLREPQEPLDAGLSEFYERLFRAASETVLRDGRWTSLGVRPAKPEGEGAKSILAWSWTHASAKALVVINYSSREAEGRIDLGPEFLPEGPRIVFEDRLSPETCFRIAAEVRSSHGTNLGPGDAVLGQRAEVRTSGFYIRLAPWEGRLFKVEDAGS